MFSNVLMYVFEAHECEKHIIHLIKSNFQETVWKGTPVLEEGVK